MAVNIRENLKLHRAHSPTNFGPLSQALQGFVNGRYPDLKVASSFGGAIGPALFRSFESGDVGDLDVLVLWLSDITDIDSKMMTFLRADLPNAEAVFGHLYKVDLSQQQ